MIPVIVGIAGIVITVGLHAGATTIISELVKEHGFASHQRFGNRARPFILGITAGCLAVKHYFDIFLWSLAYWYIADEKQFDDFESVLYFSSVTYTTLGYGDIVLTDSWRLICGIQAMNGILLFGWSTALLFFLVQRLWIVEEGAKG